jgi:hypothetical protein
MPALFAYLFSLLIFIGGGYAGLIWLTGPPVKTGSSPMAMAEMTGRLHPHNGRSKAPQPSVSDVANANLGAPAAHETPSAHETETEATSAPGAKSANASGSDNAGPGTTAEGSATAAGAGADASRGSEQDKKDSPIRDTQNSDKIDSPNRDAPVQNDASAQDKVLAKTDGIGSQKSQSQPETTATGNVSSENPQSKPVTPAADARNGAASSDTASRKEIMSRSAHRPQKEARRDGKPRDRYDGSRKIFQQASRSKLVMMTLQTIEFPDGHREQRLLPLRHSGTEDE